MTAVLCDDVAATRAPIGGGDPVVDAAAGLLSIPLRQVYAALWRLGLIEVR
ncbi:Rv1535 family protein [Mycobacterium sp. 663a-19]|nr:Rv1535 family protein [Mycobacterium sp. 663a-19]MEB3983015.1 Rv1535 family protein [Mycobacterium sp. 663a-19]